MAPKVEHELHTRRFGRNLGVGLLLVGFVVIVFGITVVKISTGGTMEAFDHVVRPAIPVEEK